MRNNETGVDVLVGMQYGSEGKGKISSVLADQYDASVRVGAWQAGHTLVYKGNDYKMRTIPCQWTNPCCDLIIGAGGMIRLDVLKHEIEMLESIGIDIRNRLYIDPRTVIGLPRHAEQEASESMFKKIGSTQEGIGACRVEKIKRKGEAIQAKNCPKLENYATVTDTIDLINLKAQSGKIFVEGTQGCHLSITTSHLYPMCTSCDPNVSGILSECGISPRLVNDIIGVARTYPIRVAGNSGNTGGKELSWDEVSKRSGIKGLSEQTTVTKRTRRVFEWSDRDFQQALLINQPTILALTFVDYFGVENAGVENLSELSDRALISIAELEVRNNCHFDILSTGKAVQETIDTRFATKGNNIRDALSEVAADF
ncbi:MAG: adenylosuccinate synthetase [Hespellia sp.]|nr:adenylosuccinate synthetase [Hespellia sp.]